VDQKPIPRENLFYFLHLFVRKNVVNYPLFFYFFNRKSIVLAKKSFFENLTDSLVLSYREFKNEFFKKTAVSTFFTVYTFLREQVTASMESLLLLFCFFFINRPIGSQHLCEIFTGRTR